MTVANPTRFRLCDDCAVMFETKLGRWNSIKPINCSNCLGRFSTGTVVQMPASKRTKKFRHRCEHPKCWPER